MIKKLEKFIFPIFAVSTFTVFPLLISFDNSQNELVTLSNISKVTNQNSQDLKKIENVI